MHYQATCINQLGLPSGVLPDLFGHSWQQVLVVQNSSTAVPLSGFAADCFLSEGANNSSPETNVTIHPQSFDPSCELGAYPIRCDRANARNV